MLWRNTGKPVERRVARRGFARFRKFLAFTMLLNVLLLTLTLLLINTRLGRSVIKDQVTAALAPVFRGKWSVLEIGWVGLGAVGGVDAVLHDEAGRPVLRVQDVDARVDLLATVVSLLSSGTDIEIEFTQARIGHVEVLLDTDSEGVPFLARAFEPAPSEQPSAAESPPSGTPARGVHLLFPRAEIQHAWVHGQLSTLPALDAELRETHGAVEVTTKAVTVKVPQLALQERALWSGQELNGTAAVSLDVPFAENEPIQLQTSIAGRVGAVPIASVARLKGDEVYVAAVLERTSAQSMREVIAGWPVHESVSAGVQARGTLPTLNFEGYFEAGTSQIVTAGSLNVDDPVSLELDARVLNFDLRVLGPDLPQSQLSATLGLRGELAERTTGTATLIAAGRVASQEIPSIRATATFSNETVSLDASLSEPSGSARVKVRGRSEGQEYAMAVNLSAHTDDLSRHDALIPNLSGKLQIEGNGELRLGDRSSADLTAFIRTQKLRVADLELANGATCVRLLGDLDDPQLMAELNAEQIVYQKQHVSRATVQASGSLSELDVRLALEGAENRPSVYANTRLKLQAETVTLVEPHLILWRERGALDVRAGEVRVAAAGISIRRGIIEGAGHPLRVEGQLGGVAATLKAKGQGLQLDHLAYVLGRDVRTEGSLDVDIDLMVSGTRAVGKVEVSLERADIKELGKGSIRASLVLDDRRLSGTLSGRLGPYYLDARAEDVMLAGSARSAHAWRDATGAIALDADVDLGRLKAVLPESSIPFDVMTGSLHVSARVERTQALSPPQLVVDLKTERLGVSVKGEEQPRFDGKVVHAPPKWKLSGIDLEVSARVTGPNGATQFLGHVFDRRGTVIALAFDAEVPYRTLAANPKAFRQQLSDLPIHAKVIVPRRAVDTLPAPLRVKGISGEVEGVLDFTQQQRVPTVRLQMAVHRMQFQERADAVPVTAEAHAEYRGDHGRVDVKLACADKPTLTGSAEITGDLSRLIRGEEFNSGWRAVTRMDAARFPLKTIPVLAERRVDGELTGKATLEIANDVRPAFDAELKVDGLKIGDVKYTEGRVTAQLADDSLKAAAKLKQSDGGFLSLSARMRRNAKTFDGQRKNEAGPFASALIDVTASKFRASALQPFLQGTVAQLDGLLEGQVKVDLTGKRSHLRGQLALRQGTLQLETFGEELHGVEGQVTFRPNGVIVLESIRARGVNGKLEAAGSARLDGLSLAQAHITVNIPKREPLPVVIEGESMAEAWTNLEIDIIQQENTTSVTINVRKAGIRVPDKSAHDLQALEPPAAIRVGVQRTPTQFVILPTMRDGVAAPPPPIEQKSLRIAINLNNVEVRRGTTLRTRLDGRLSVTAGQTNEVRGQIRLSKGYLDVEGKRFEIERGVITFVGDPGNPQVVLTAGWTAPEGTRVYADFVGPLKTGRVTLRAEPSRTQSEILALILFGTSDGQAVPVNSSQQSSDPGASGAALGLGGGIAAQGINRALDDITGLDITTRVDTEDGSNPRPEIEVQVAQDIALSIAHALGSPSAAEGLDRNFLTLDWRFLRNWSLETTFGDRGSVVMDAVWQLRY
ncbi:MAG TPA: translocation/assembly module TamB domain-containing protein [Polyangiaceae bacterium]|nr:translocation/assembly module TamB domain-containing protein [Polyangiaceae bacterium]